MFPGLMATGAAPCATPAKAGLGRCCPTGMLLKLKVARPVESLLLPRGLAIIPATIPVGDGRFRPVGVTAIDPAVEEEFQK